MTTSLLTVRTINPSEWREYRTIRLRALQDSPDAFGSTYEMAAQYPEENWVARLKGLSDSTDHPMFAVINGKPVGLAWAKIESPDTEVAHLYQMWVDPAVRGKGIGEALMKEAIHWSKRCGTTTLRLDVTAGDRPARRLYERLGFKPVGELVPLRPGSDLLEQTMDLRLGEVNDFQLD